MSEALASDADAVAGQVDAHPAADHHLADEPLEFTPEQLDALLAERDEFLDAYRRTAADFDNYRKQAQKRITDEVARSQGSFVERLLPVLDAIEAAQTHTDGDDAGGVDAVSKALFGFLEKEGLERVAPAGEPFDPNVRRSRHARARRRRTHRRRGAPHRLPVAGPGHPRRHGQGRRLRPSDLFQ